MEDQRVWSKVRGSDKSGSNGAAGSQSRTNRCHKSGSTCSNGSNSTSGTNGTPSTNKESKSETAPISISVTSVRVEGWCRRSGRTKSTEVCTAPTKPNDKEPMVSCTIAPINGLTWVKLGLEQTNSPSLNQCETDKSDQGIQQDGPRNPHNPHAPPEPVSYL